MAKKKKRRVTMYQVNFGIVVNVPSLAKLIKADLQVLQEKYKFGCIITNSYTLAPTGEGARRHRKLIQEDKALVKKLKG